MDEPLCYLHPESSYISFWGHPDWLNDLYPPWNWYWQKQWGIKCHKRPRGLECAFLISRWSQFFSRDDDPFIFDVSSWTCLLSVSFFGIEFGKSDHKEAQKCLTLRTFVARTPQVEYLTVKLLPLIIIFFSVRLPQPWIWSKFKKTKKEKRTVDGDVHRTTCSFQQQSH